MKRLMTALLLSASASVGAEEMRHSMHHGYFYGLQADALEYRYGDSGEELGYWSTEAWWGTDELKALWLSEAEYSFDHDSWETLDNRLALQTPLSDFIDLRGGLRFDIPDGENRQYAFVGLNGLLPLYVDCGPCDHGPRLIIGRQVTGRCGPEASRAWFVDGPSPANTLRQFERYLVPVLSA